MDLQPVAHLDHERLLEGQRQHRVDRLHEEEVAVGLDDEELLRRRVDALEDAPDVGEREERVSGAGVMRQVVAPVTGSTTRTRWFSASAMNTRRT